MRHEARDRCLKLLIFRHGLCESEACNLVLSQVDTLISVLHVQRLKGGLATTHPFTWGLASRHQGVAFCPRQDEKGQT